MDYEKEYKEALERARAGKPIDEVFPELRESEDERIIVNIKKAVELYWSDEPLDEILSWLEKQKEPLTPEEKMNHQLYLEGFDVGKNVGEVVTKPAEWSEEDEKMLSDCIEAVGSMSVRSDVKTLRDWLKSLRPQPEQEWTKEDNERYLSCLKRLGTGNPDQPETVNSKWFREHVCPQPCWKPSNK